MQTHKKGMRIGSTHTWTYSKGTWKEKKVSPKTWNFNYYNSKTRKGRQAPRGTGMPTGSKLIWRIKANQYAIKVSPNKYKLIMKGKKYMGRWKTPKKRKWSK